MTAVVAVLAGTAVAEAVLVGGLLVRRRRARAGARVRAALERRMAAQQGLARILADEGSAAGATAQMARAVAANLGWDVAIVWEVADEEAALRATDGWARDAALDAFRRAHGRAPLTHGSGLAGRVWAAGEGVWVEDVTDDGEDAAHDAGVRSALAVPLVRGTAILGVLELLATRQRRRDADELGALGAMARLIAASLAERRAHERHGALLGAEHEARDRADRAERRATFLAEAGPLLAASLDVGSTAATVIRLAVPELADFCAVDIADDPRGAVRRAALGHVSRAHERRALEAANRSAAPDGPVLRALERDSPVLVPSADAALVSAGLLEPRDLDAMRELELRAALVVPMRSPDGVLGAITLGVGASDRAIGTEDLAVAEGLADRAAQALRNARLFQAERAARDEAQRSAHGLAEAEERFRTAFEHAPIGVGLMSVRPQDHGRWLQVNPALCDIVGYDADRLLAMPTDELTHPDDREEDAAAVRELVAGTIPEVRREKRYVHANGHPVWVQVRAALVRGPDGEASHTVAQVQDITDRKRYEGQLQYLADHDALTGIFNRRRFEEELDRAVAHARRFDEPAAVLVIDLDNFKYVNDTYGHSVGDELLGRIAGALKARLRETDVCGRLGGDEFAAILPRVTPSEARAAAAALLETIRRDGAVTIGERRVRATCSIGISAIESTTELTAGELLVEADVAMYEAKEAGRDRVAAVAPGEASRAKMKARMTWSERIRDALEHDHFELWEQPILTLATGAQERAEVLVRMLDANGDAIPPGVFLYIAERFGQIQAVDRWVIGRSIRLLAARDRLVEVNLSGASITDEATIDFIASEIANAPIDPTKLVFEVTETTAIVNVERARRFARRLSDLGCQFALDDFGAGFGSFYYLKHLPFDCVKIDGDFVKELPVSAPDQLTVQAIVQIARGLGKETVAEFVQDEATIELLREYGVDYAQGYHVGRPRRALEGRRPDTSRLRVAPRPRP